MTVGPPVAPCLACSSRAACCSWLSRFTVFDSVNGLTAADVGITSTAWVLGVGVPLVGALLLFIALGEHAAGPCRWPSDWCSARCCAR